MTLTAFDRFINYFKLKSELSKARKFYRCTLKILSHLSDKVPYQLANIRLAYLTSSVVHTKSIYSRKGILWWRTSNEKVFQYVES